MIKFVQDLDIDEYLKSKAENFAILNDRTRFKELVSLVESAISGKNIILGGEYARAAATGGDIDMIKFPVYDLHSTNPEKDAHMITDLLFNSNTKIEKRSIYTETVSKSIFAVCADYRRIIMVNGINQRTGTNMINVISPNKINAPETNSPIQVMPRNLLISSQLQQLYNPEPDIPHSEVIQTIVQLSNNKRGGNLFDCAPAGITSSQYIEYAVTGGSDINILKFIRKSPNAVVVGDISAKFHKWGKATNKIRQKTQNRAQILTSAREDEFASLFPFKTKIVRFAIFSPDDPFLRKYSIYSLNNDRQTLICDVFNSPQYEMIPYIEKNGIKYANKAVVARFNILDSISQRAVYHITGAKFSDRLKLANNLAECADLMVEDILECLRRDPFSIVQTEGYHGNRIGQRVMMKRVSGRSIFQPKYSPYKNSIDKNSIDKKPQN